MSARVVMFAATLAALYCAAGYAIVATMGSVLS